MEKDFHYYLVHAMAVLTGTAHADTVAYASQFVDDNNEGGFIIDDAPAAFPQRIRAGRGWYCPVMTQSLSPRSLERSVQENVYVPFHFVPGDSTVRINGKTNPRSVTPDSTLARTILDAALASGDPYRLGIALHTYADTWSHQNFSGIREDWNAVYPWYNIFKSLAPNIGHAEVGRVADILSETWTDFRLKLKADNRERGLQAAEKIYRALRRATQSGPAWKDIRADVRRIIECADYDRRAGLSIALAKEQGAVVPAYNKSLWIDEALDRRGGRIVMRADFAGTHWYRFNEAARIQRESITTKNTKA
jgi:hypothetical protein